MACQVLGAEAGNGYFFTDREFGCGKLDGMAGLPQHAPQQAHLFVGNGSKGALAVAPVEHEETDAGFFHHLAALCLSDVQENVLGDDHALYLLALLAVAVLIDLDFFLRGDKGLVTHVQQPLTRAFFPVGAHTGDVPLALQIGAFRYACGAASAHHRR